MGVCQTGFMVLEDCKEVRVWMFTFVYMVRMLSDFKFSIDVWLWRVLPPLSELRSSQNMNCQMLSIIHDYRTTCALGLIWHGREHWERKKYAQHRHNPRFVPPKACSQSRSLSLPTYKWSLEFNNVSVYKRINKTVVNNPKVNKESGF